MSGYKKRTYRHHVSCKDLISCELRVKETDLFIRTDVDVRKQALDLVYQVRENIEAYIRGHPVFVSSLHPLEEDPYAPEVVKEMIGAGRKVGIGPMAAVAGAVAEFVGKSLLNHCREAIVENGGDIFIKVDRPIKVGIFAGRSPLSNKLAVHIRSEETPMGICSSSGTVGHSLSLGRADVACVLAKSTSLADAAATALGNRVKSASGINRALEWIQGVEDIMGALIVVKEKMGVWGRVDLRSV